MKKLNKRIVSILIALAMVVMSVPGEPVLAAGGNYGWGATWISRLVYEDFTLHEHVDNKSISAGEGFTIIGYQLGNYKISYSTSTGGKEGWISSDYLTIDTANAWAGLVTSLSTTKTYARPSSSSYQIGSVSNGEIVSIFGREGSYYYIEYNVNDQNYKRKRGWVPMGAISVYGDSLPAENSFYFMSYEFTLNGEPLYYAPGNYDLWTRVPTNRSGIMRSAQTIHGEEFAYVEFTGTNGELLSGYLRTDL